MRKDFNRLVEECIRARKSGRALDIGAGQGRYSLMLAKRGLRVLAIDKDKMRLSRLAERVKALKLPVKTKVIAIENFAFPKEEFDFISAVNVLHFFPKNIVLQKLIPKIISALKPGGVFLLSLHSVRSPLYNLYKRRFTERRKDSFSRDTDGLVVSFFRIKELRRALAPLTILYLASEKLPSQSAGHQTLIYVLAVRR